MKVYTEGGDEILETNHPGTFLVKVRGHYFTAIDCRLKDYKPGTKIKADYMGQLTHEPENLPWKIWYLDKTKKTD